MGLTQAGAYEWGTKRKYLNLNTKGVPVFVWKPKDQEAQTFSSVEGDFISISFLDNEYEWEVNRKLELILRDGDEDYYIQSSFSKTARSILNSLASLKDWVGRIFISVYEKDGKKSVSFKHNWEKVSRFMTGEETNALVKELGKKWGKPVYDTTELDERLEANCSWLFPASAFVDERLHEADKPTETEADQLPF